MEWLKDQLNCFPDVWALTQALPSSLNSPPHLTPISQAFGDLMRWCPATTECFCFHYLQADTSMGHRLTTSQFPSALCGLLGLP